MTQYHSQCGQDQFIRETFFPNKIDGVFVDVGAYDGQTFSNTLAFERLGWRGLCVEPLPDAFRKLKDTRHAICENVAAANFDGLVLFTEADCPINGKMLSGLSHHMDVSRIDGLPKNEYRVRALSLSQLLSRHALTHVDFMSIDVEGSELLVLKGLDFDRFDVSVLAIEDNRAGPEIPTFMHDKGYTLVTRLEQDYVFSKIPMPGGPPPI